MSIESRSTGCHVHEGKLQPSGVACRTRTMGQEGVLKVVGVARYKHAAVGTRVRPGAARVRVAGVPRVPPRPGSVVVGWGSGNMPVGGV